MRIGMGALGLGDYQPPPGLTGPITLFDGTVISDPANTPASRALCMPTMCGADPTNQKVKYWCAFNGYSGALGCSEPECAPYKSAVPFCNLPAWQPSPAVPAPPAVPPTLTPASIVQPLPNITVDLAPVPVPTPKCSLWCDINGAIDNNPLLAAALLAGVALIIWKR